MASFLAVLVGVLLLVPAALGDTVVIDFTDAALWSGAGGAPAASADYGALTVNVSARQGGLLSFNPGTLDGPSFLARDGSGLGIGDSQITYSSDADLLEVSFSADVTVTGFYGFNLLAGDSARANFGRIGPNTVIVTSGASTTGSGYFAVTGISVADFTEVHFGATAGDWSLAAIVVETASQPTAVPLPSTASSLLALLGGIGIAVLLRRSTRIHHA